MYELLRGDLRIIAHILITWLFHQIMKEQGKMYRWHSPTNKLFTSTMYNHARTRLGVAILGDHATPRMTSLGASGGYQNML